MEEEVEKEIESYENITSQVLPVCTCTCDSIAMAQISIEETPISERKQKILSTVQRTESYLREYRIPELIRYLLTMILAHLPNNPISYLEKLLDACMLFRAGHGVAPVLYENRHLEAVIKSFDPGQRGWLNGGQAQRVYTTLGLINEELIEEKIPCDVLLDTLKQTQEIELFQLLSAGTDAFNDKNNNKEY
ncbi:uncharacterized protein LOC112049631 [Bicyclus anynana]|uniref:Uncharacterized protein LOC112049631 n=1 Tax=Bicyclus anynana TaxID=110368 RepID=A0A6J1NJQ3_BICAN|nr:uncharacterized protein LOC112049631 [Bicyclus anynana]